MIYKKIKKNVRIEFEMNSIIFFFFFFVHPQITRVLGSVVLKLYFEKKLKMLLSIICEHNLIFKIVHIKNAHICLLAAT